ncbi:MAG: hypothetical protein A2Z18_00110 [Armatimonadetes bacterium RBG_16_58_9]|nr:MAG: hypothetical protein A2Z18_00110 [Armatimonadetes bacterium RBG_16_58_9]
MLKIKNYINGEWCGSESGKTSVRTNPANYEQTVGQHPASDGADAKKAVDAAQAAFAQWKEVPGPKRAQLLQKAVENIKARVEDIAKGLTLEQGKPLAEARAEANRGIEEMEYWVGEGCRMEGRHLPTAKEGAICYTVREPIGVVAAITPWNYPMIPSIRKVCPAVVYGNTVVLKPASLTPFTSAAVVQCFHDAGFPPGVVNLVIGSGSSVGKVLTEDSHVRGITLTGSGEVGKKIAEGASRHNARLQLEMGGKNPAVVFESADVELAAANIVARAFTCAGQLCVSISRVIVQDTIADRLMALLKERIKKVIVGNGMETGATMGPLVSEEHLESVLGYVKAGLDEGATLVTGGERLTGPKYDNGNYMSPALFTNVDPRSTIGQEEIFGPVLAVTRFGRFEEALEIANGVKYGLASCCYTGRLDEALAFVKKAQAGMVQVNLPTYVDAWAPFGGFKESGFGPHEVGYTNVEFFTEQKTVYLFA